MTDRAVELHVAGQKCRVVTTADEGELQDLANMVEDKLAAVLPEGRPVTTQAMLLAAIALAADVRDSKKQADRIEYHARQTLGGLMERVDSAISDSDTISLERDGRRKRNSNKGVHKQARANELPNDPPTS